MVLQLLASRVPLIVVISAALVFHLTKLAGDLTFGRKYNNRTLFFCYITPSRQLAQDLGTEALQVVLVRYSFSH